MNQLLLQKVQKFLKDLQDHNEANENGDTLLHAFVRRRDKYSQDCLLALLVYGQCDVDGGNHQGFTPLHIAAEVCIATPHFYSIVWLKCALPGQVCIAWSSVHEAHGYSLLTWVYSHDPLSYQVTHSSSLYMP